MRCSDKRVEGTTKDEDMINYLFFVISTSCIRITNEIDMERSGILESVETYLSKGILCLPIKSGAKTPAPGVKWSSLTTPELCREAFARCETNSLGVICGKLSNVFVVDLDLAKNDDEISGIDWLELVESRNDVSLETYAVRTRSGGMHLYFTLDDKLASFSNRVKSMPVDGKRYAVDIRTTGGYVVATPTPGYDALTLADDDRCYQETPEEMPDWFYREVCALYGIAEPAGDAQSAASTAVEGAGGSEPITNLDEPQTMSPMLLWGDMAQFGSEEREIDEALLEEALGGLPEKFLNDVNSWGGTLANVFSLLPEQSSRYFKPTERLVYEVFDQWSKKSKSYDADDNRKQWDCHKNRTSRLGDFRTILGIVIKERRKNTSPQEEMEAKIKEMNLPEDDELYTLQDLEKESEFFRSEEHMIKAFRKCVFYVAGGNTWVFKERRVGCDREYYIDYYRSKKLAGPDNFTVRNPQTGKNERLDKLILKQIRSIMYDDFGWWPLPDDIPAIPNTYNTFRGFKASPVKNQTAEDAFVNHITNIWCRGDAGSANYVLDLLAFVIQRPEQLPEKVLLVRSLEGAGKGIIATLLGRYVIGQSMYLATSSLDTVLGKFNGALECKKLVLLDEADSSSDPALYAARLKAAVSEKYCTIEQKFMDVRVGYNYAFIMLFTNKTQPIHIDVGDRRTVCLNASGEKVGDTDYFNQLTDTLLCETGANAVMYHLKTRDLSKFDNRKPPPITEYKEMLTNVCMSSDKQFVKRWVTDKPADDTVCIVDKDEFWEEYKNQRFADGGKYLAKQKFQEFVLDHQGISDILVRDEMDKSVRHHKYKLDLSRLRKFYNIKK
jgi:hypothetical protein